MLSFYNYQHSNFMLVWFHFTCLHCGKINKPPLYKRAVFCILNDQ
jgi:hypothetical protein